MYLLLDTDVVLWATKMGFFSLHAATISLKPENCHGLMISVLKAGYLGQLTIQPPLPLEVMENQF